jgi:hypothetical protein
MQHSLLLRPRITISFWLLLIRAPFSPQQCVCQGFVRYEFIRTVDYIHNIIIYSVLDIRISMLNTVRWRYRSLSLQLIKSNTALSHYLVRQRVELLSSNLQ